jgi:steroid delta-isomerase-like uncharacterized protein
MSREQHKDLVQRFVCILNDKEHVNALRELLADHCLVNGHPMRLADLQDFTVMMRTAFPDEQLTVETIVAEGDWVAMRISSQATHRGPWSSPLGIIPPTQQTWSQTGMQFFRVHDGLIRELWTEWNVLGQLQQLGAVAALDLVAV